MTDHPKIQRLRQLKAEAHQGGGKEGITRLHEPQETRLSIGDLADELNIFLDVGHSPHLERPDDFANTLTQFVISCSCHEFTPSVVVEKTRSSFERLKEGILNFFK